MLPESDTLTACAISGKPLSHPRVPTFALAVYQTINRRKLWGRRVSDLRAMLAMPCLMVALTFTPHKRPRAALWRWPDSPAARAGTIWSSMESLWSSTGEGHGCTAQPGVSPDDTQGLLTSLVVPKSCQACSSNQLTIRLDLGDPYCIGEYVARTL